MMMKKRCWKVGRAKVEIATQKTRDQCSIGHLNRLDLTSQKYEPFDCFHLVTPSLPPRSISRTRRSDDATMSAATAVKKEEQQNASNKASSSSNRLPPYLPSTTSKPPDLPRAYLNGTQDMLSLFGLMPIYDRAVRPYNPDTAPAEASASTSAAAGTASVPAANAATAAAPGATPSVLAARSSSATPRPNTANAGGHPPSSGGRISTPALQLNGGPPTFSLHTDSSAILAASPGQLAASAEKAPPAKKPTKPPPTYAHYVDDLAGRVRPPRKSARAAKADKGTSLMSILFKPEYTPQRIVPFDRETMESAFKVEPGAVPEIDQGLLEPDVEEESGRGERPRKKKKKDRAKEGAAMASSGPPSAARTPSRR